VIQLVPVASVPVAAVAVAVKVIQTPKVVSVRFMMCSFR
jgi:hypothetical protein